MASVTKSLRDDSDGGATSVTRRKLEPEGQFDNSGDDDDVIRAQDGLVLECSSDEDSI